MAVSAASALKALKAVADESHKHVCYSQPEMLPAWQDSYDAQLMAAAKAALDAGTNPQVGRTEDRLVVSAEEPVHNAAVF